MAGGLTNLSQVLHQDRQSQEEHHHLHGTVHLQYAADAAAKAKATTSSTPTTPVKCSDKTVIQRDNLSKSLGEIKTCVYDDSHLHRLLNKLGLWHS